MSAERVLPARLAEIVADFEMCAGREKLELLLEYARQFPPFPAELSAQLQVEDVPECMTPVQMVSTAEQGRLSFYFDVPPESPTIRGYAAVVMRGLSDVTPEEILAVPPEFYLQMGLQEVLSAQRLNGMAAILAHIKRRAMRELVKT